MLDPSTATSNAATAPASDGLDVAVEGNAYTHYNQMAGAVSALPSQGSSQAFRKQVDALLQAFRSDGILTRLEIDVTWQFSTAYTALAGEPQSQAALGRMLGTVLQLVQRQQGQTLTRDQGHVAHRAAEGMRRGEVPASTAERVINDLEQASRGGLTREEADRLVARLDPRAPTPGPSPIPKRVPPPTEAQAAAAKQGEAIITRDRPEKQSWNYAAVARQRDHHWAVVRDSTQSETVRAAAAAKWMGATAATAFIRFSPAIDGPRQPSEQYSSAGIDGTRRIDQAVAQHQQYFDAVQGQLDSSVVRLLDDAWSWGQSVINGGASAQTALSAGHRAAGRKPDGQGFLSEAQSRELGLSIFEDATGRVLSGSTAALPREGESPGAYAARMTRAVKSEVAKEWLELSTDALFVHGAMHQGIKAAYTAHRQRHAESASQDSPGPKQGSPTTHAPVPAAAITTAKPLEPAADVEQGVKRDLLEQASHDPYLRGIDRTLRRIESRARAMGLTHLQALDPVRALTQRLMDTPQARRRLEQVVLNQVKAYDAQIRSGTATPDVLAKKQALDADVHKGMMATGTALGLGLELGLGQIEAAANAGKTTNRAEATRLAGDAAGGTAGGVPGGPIAAFVGGLIGSGLGTPTINPVAPDTARLEQPATGTSLLGLEGLDNEPGVGIPGSGTSHGGKQWAAGWKSDGEDAGPISDDQYWDGIRPDLTLAEFEQFRFVAGSADNDRLELFRRFDLDKDDTLSVAEFRNMRQFLFRQGFDVDGNNVIDLGELRGGALRPSWRKDHASWVGVG